MYTIRRAGPYFYATALAGFGLLELVSGDFLPGLLPVSASLPLRLYWVYLSALIFLFAAAGIFTRRWRQQAAILASATFFLFFLLVYLPRLLEARYNPGDWSAAFEILLLASGGKMVAFTFAGEVQWKRLVTAGEITALYLFAISLVVFGVLDIRYNDYLQTLIPPWMPAHLWVSYVVIAGFLLSAFSYLTNLKVPLASSLLGIMFLSGVLLLNLPRVFSQPGKELEWTSLFVALAVSGVAFSLTFGIYRRTE